MAKKTNANPIDEDTHEILQTQVKKGKLRRFLIMYKGAAVKTLVVFKRGTLGSKIMAAKRAGFKGDVLCGVVVGSGQKLRFMIPANDAVAAAMKVDSWETEVPLSKAKLRTFFADQSLAYKPSLSLIKDPALATKQATKPANSEKASSLPTK